MICFMFWKDGWLPYGELIVGVQEWRQEDQFRGGHRRQERDGDSLNHRGGRGDGEA